MLLKTLKTELELRQAAGVPLKATYLDKTLKELQIGDLIIRMDNYVITAAQVIHYETETRYRLVCRVLDFAPVITYHEYEREAKQKAETFGEFVSTEITKVEVQISEDGVITENISQVQSTDEDLPF